MRILIDPNTTSTGFGIGQLDETDSDTEEYRAGVAVWAISRCCCAPIHWDSGSFIEEIDHWKCSNCKDELTTTKNNIQSGVTISGHSFNSDVQRLVRNWTGYTDDQFEVEVSE